MQNPTKHERVLLYEKRALLVLLAFAITVGQLAFAFLWAVHDNPSFIVKYLSLWEHDSQWYAHILEHGYRVNRYPFLAPGNNMAHIGFFPGYPMAAYAVRAITRLYTKEAMLFTSQLFAVGMWTYFLLLLRRLRVPRVLQLAAVATVVSFPSAFFLIAAYSESMFLCMLLGYLYWITSEKKYGWVLAAIHGFLMSSTRIVGIPLMIIPLLWVLLENNYRPKIDRKMITVSLATLFSAALFFLYCQSTLGSWNAYSQAQAIGWGVIPNYSAIFDLSIYIMQWPAMSWDGFVKPDDISRISVPICLIAFLLLLAAELACSVHQNRKRDRHFRILCYTSSAFLLFITVSGLWSRQMTSVIRYMLPVVVLYTLCAVSLLSQGEVFKAKYSKWLAVAAFAFLLAVFTFVQAGHIDMFSYGAWVA